MEWHQPQYTVNTYHQPPQMEWHQPHTLSKISPASSDGMAPASYTGTKNNQPSQMGWHQPLYTVNKTPSSSDEMTSTSYTVTKLISLLRWNSTSLEQCQKKSPDFSDRKTPASIHCHQK
jgi:hypothetical protein